ncbi:MAG: HAD hydrolase-like protein, partial [Candidatus Diapherotrites archaeon]|nr:HAD hydrolase-like protein [Candidatus Diapherotrites archaeon]
SDALMVGNSLGSDVLQAEKVGIKGILLSRGRQGRHKTEVPSLFELEKFLPSVRKRVSKKRVVQRKPRIIKRNLMH